MSDAAEIKKFVDDQKQKTGRKALEERIEDTYDLWRMEPFEFPPVDGKPVTDYKIMTTNKPRVFADKLVSELAFGTLKLSIPVYDETKKERTEESMTEQTAYGLTAIADDRERSFARPCTQAQEADDIIIRGWAVPRIWIYEENKELIVDIAQWDIRTVYWLTGSKGLSKVVNVRYTTKEEVDDLYGISSVEDFPGGVTVYDHWDDKIEQVVVGDKIVFHQKNNRGYIPVLILPVGSARQRYSSRHQDTLKDVGEDFAARIKDVAKRMSEIMSYYLTIVALGTHPNLLAYYKGSKIDFGNKNPYGSGSVVDLDLNKEQRIEPMFKWTMPQDALVIHNIIADWLSDGTGPDVMYGRLAQAATAQGTAMLIHAAMGAMKNGQRAVEQSNAWKANELIKQFKEFKDGKFKEVNLQGVTGKEKQFTVTPDRKKLITDRRFMCQLALDAPQDIMQNISGAAQLVASGIISRLTARDKFFSNLVPDTDVEESRINQEVVREALDIPAWEALTDLQKKDPEGYKTAIWILYKYLKEKAMQGQQMAQGQPSGENVSGIPQGMTPATNRPNENARLSKLGLQRGR